MSHLAQDYKRAGLRIAAQLSGITECEAIRQLRAAGVDTTKPHVDTRLARAAAMARAGVSQNTIAKHLHIDERALRHIIKREKASQ